MYANRARYEVQEGADPAIEICSFGRFHSGECDCVPFKGDCLYICPCQGSVDFIPELQQCSGEGARFFLNEEPAFSSSGALLLRGRLCCIWLGRWWCGLRRYCVRPPVSLSSHGSPGGGGGGL